MPEAAMPFPANILGPAAAWLPLFERGAGPREVARPFNLVPAFDSTRPLPTEFTSPPVQDEVETFIPRRRGGEVRWISQGSHVTCRTIN